MDKFDQTINSLERFKTKSPVLSSLWKNYLSIKKEHLEKQITNCNTMMEMMENDGVDITLPTIILLHLIYNQEYT
jgi:hypothetical protein|tara:strand:- start:1551 stop:1775 length:225 start_codon:yes stop_codon:yes gene_type:complete